MIEHLRHLMKFDRWANGETIASLTAAPEVPSRALATIAHVIAAERLWLDRVHGVAGASVWPDRTLQEVASAAAAVGESWAEFLSRSEDATLARSVRYTNSRGETFDSTIGTVVLHLITHGAYHRGQVATLLRQAGGTPAMVDYIHASRQHLIED